MVIRFPALIVFAALAVPAVVNAQPEPCVRDFASPEDVVLAGGSVGFCDDHRKPGCYSVDLATGKLAIAKIVAPPEPPPVAELKVGDESASVCFAGKKACTVLRPRSRIDPGLGMGGAINASGSFAALDNGNQIETFDVRTRTRLATFSAGKGACSGASFLAGDVLLVQNADCGTDSIASRLTTLKGKTLTAIGGDKPIPVAGRVHLDGVRYAFMSSTGDVVVIQDVKTGKVEQRITIGAPINRPPTLVGNSSRLAIVFGGAVHDAVAERWGDVAVVDLATAKVTVHTAKRCPR